MSVYTRAMYSEFYCRKPSPQGSYVNFIVQLTRKTLISFFIVLLAAILVTAFCSPTRSMLMTGVDNHRNGLGNALGKGACAYH